MPGDQGKARFDAYLDDYACLANGLVSLYEATFDERWIAEAIRLADEMLRWFADADGGGFFFTASDHEQLVARNKDLFDNATPSGNGMAATALLRLTRLTGRNDYLTAVDGALAAALPVLERSPMAGGQLLLVYDMLLGPTPEIVITPGQSAAETAAILTDLRQRYLPNKVVAMPSPADAAAANDAGPLAELLSGKPLAGEQPVMHICENFACQAPVVGKEAIHAVLDRLTAVPSGGL